MTDIPIWMKRALAHQDTCPECLGELDTGWECNSCGYDAIEDAKACTNADILKYLSIWGETIRC